ncbi:MAG: GNAT family N-acetyltransferase [Pirellulaceae bacterium]|nr:GNAT family N-acetyltransferase [Pirellulaceae bacterium]
MLHVKPISSLADLSSLLGQWNLLTEKVPFRQWQWLVPWWKHYGNEDQLYVLAVYLDETEKTLVGIAPWYLREERGKGRTIRFLGDGEVCTDYQAILVQPNHQQEVSQTLAMWLTERASSAESRWNWDLLEFEGCITSEITLTHFFEELEGLGNSVDFTEGEHCWRITLPDDWEAYLAMQSKSHRKQIRRSKKHHLDTKKAVLKTADSKETFDRYWEVFVELHQKRRKSLGEEGCFTSPRFSGFLREAAELFFGEEQLGLYVVEYEKVPIAVDFHLLGNQVSYAYQSGIDPDSLSLEPGRLVNVAMIEKAILEGNTGYDFMRGDEPYKKHFRAEPLQSATYRVFPDKASAQIRRNIWKASEKVKTWIKSGFSSVGLGE